MASILRGIRRAAPRLSLPQDFFVCQQCISQARPAVRHVKLPIKPSVSQASPIRFSSSAAGISPNAGATLKAASPLGSLSKTISEKSTELEGRAREASGNKFFPDTSSSSVAYWLLASAGSVFGIVVFGGLTRLTESGLSITEWRPVTGSLPPLSTSDWDSEFEKYRASPESKLLNAHMTLEEFKKIYWMEWGHRLWGRFVGLSFVLPAIYFVSRRRVSANMSLRLLGISGLIGFQGFLGWYMVKSGLKDDLFAPGSHPRVSQYRLTAHLGAAFVCYVAMLWNGLSILRTNSLLSHPARGHAQLQHLSSSTLSIFRKSVAGLAILVFATAMSGGLVAGLDAGMIYNEFPRMGTGLAPPKSEIWSSFYSRREDGSDLWWRNMLENPSLVQLDHRILATTTFTAILSLWAYSRFNPRVRAALPNTCRKGMLGVVHLVFMQVALGISTLIYLVPLPLAAMHQAGSLALLTGVLVLGNRAWIPKRTWKLVQKRIKVVADAGLGGSRHVMGGRGKGLKADVISLRAEMKRHGPPTS
ncbi:Cytochrome c oxidase assembly protein COX15 [Venustampulla echinocandica]|uniref:Cytochrome c oxidase assembly protein COX15 n=1 Tax=Venustampulla echinocandica TaxID=2656787 RepID=A0A370TN73_9HELO|nr:Cytochrome c oxidase assembly protein COX15 [Venustampulla echinocandica]RDL36971.1 Cytochrome c oxidase assembly protein COX15 [Venustampulla echinocandica]